MCVCLCVQASGHGVGCLLSPIYDITTSCESGVKFTHDERGGGHQAKCWS